MAVDLSIPLDQLIAAKLGSLSLKDDEDTVAFVKDLVEEDSFEPEDRKSAILGLLEADEDGASLAPLPSPAGDVELTHVHLQRRSRTRSTRCSTTRRRTRTQSLSSAARPRRQQLLLHQKVRLLLPL